jgi:hypothetical protein
MGIGAILSVNDGECVHTENLSNAGIEYQCVPLSDAAPPRPGDCPIALSAEGWEKLALNVLTAAP